EALVWLYGTQRFGIKLGLENVRRLFGELNLPEQEQRVIHVAGTNGKGSVCAMIDSILRARGYRTGLFTSPHLITFRERVQVNRTMILKSDVADGLTIIHGLIADWQPHPTFFEITTALALWHFQRTDCEIVVLETGMGGRLDATNATQPIVSVITPIDYDHESWLGNSLMKIAAEKAGIIKANTPVVSAPQWNEAEQVIRARAAECAAPLQFVTESCCHPVALVGSHQKQNAALAIAALRAGKIAIDEDAITRGLASVNWPARFQRWDKRTVIDGAHNPAGARALAKTWQESFGSERATVILGVLRDKDVVGICRALEPITRRVLLPQIRSERALPPHELEKIINTSCSAIAPEVFPSFREALNGAQKNSAPILITGSLHFAGEALATLQGVPTAYEECAQ
ncbi:MAG: bifunctional folylpolyglutamate synthase/dihydrofolate synthase, partial [Verrucomicrobiota bacterium]|nr:bifunctional folylpolyglutamate synthase/dihydrofolate synthase [Verrucomicrobiota bacterium]